MVTLRMKVCTCGEDVYEDDYGDDPRDGYRWCINCGKPHRIETLLDEAVLQIEEQ